MWYAIVTIKRCNNHPFATCENNLQEAILMRPNINYVGEDFMSAYV